MKKAIVIPSYKAEKTLPGVLERIPDEFWESDGIAIIVNDCSPDATGEVADKLAEKNPKVRVVHHLENQGYGGAQKTGLETGLSEGAEAFAVVHADGQYPPELVLSLMQPILQGEAHIVQGSRFVGGGAREGGMPIHRYLANIGLTMTENVAFGTHMAEFHSGYMLYSGELLRRVPYKKLQNNYNFDAEMILLAHLIGLRCAELPIPTRYDDEVSSLNPIPYGMNVLKMIGRFSSGHYHHLLKRAAQDDRRKHPPEISAQQHLQNLQTFGATFGAIGAFALVTLLVSWVKGRGDD